MLSHWRKGHRYGTIICDLERQQVIDLLPDREGATVEAWLAEHPGVEIVSRDRGGGYGQSVARALSQAVQVADRWHLLENASCAFIDAVRRSMWDIRRVLGAGEVSPDLLTAAERIQYLWDSAPKGDERGDPVTGQGHGVDQGDRSAHRCQPPGRPAHASRGERDDVFRSRQSSLHPWLPRLDAEWAGGCRNGAELWRRLRSAGFSGGLRVVTEWATRRRRAEKVPAAPRGDVHRPEPSAG